MSAPGTTAPAGSANSCAPSFPSVAWNGGYICVASPAVGTTFDGSSGFALCTYHGLIARPVGGSDWTCEDAATALPGDIAAFEGTASQGAVICKARGLSVSDSAVNGLTVKVCGGDVSSPVADTAALGKLGTIASNTSATTTSTAGTASMADTNSLIWCFGLALLGALVLVMILQGWHTFGRLTS